jgi:pyrroloquinoline quinone (PQQ) biosynthesis protein C
MIFSLTVGYILGFVIGYIRGVEQTVKKVSEIIGKTKEIKADAYEFDGHITTMN